ncbi:MAG: hypothetical protein Q8T09_11220 [Candidatus Melainabacteria bacterium]|nr:hypothetical protein [Candidatus Melainabacteria bacterium]
MAISNELRAQLLSIALSEAEVAVLENNGLDTDAALVSVTKDELKEVGLSVGARNKIKAAFPTTVAADTLNLEVKAEAVADAPFVTANPYAYLLGNSASSLGFSAQALNPRIKPDFIRSAAQAASSFVLVGTGLCDVFTRKDFWQQLQLEDLELRSRISRWTENFRTERYISNEALGELGEGVSQLFGMHFQNLVSSSSKLSSQQGALQLLGNQARIDVGSDAASYGQLQTLIPLAAEEISQRMISSPLPEMSVSFVSLLRDLLDILKDSRLQAAAGITNATSADEGAILFLQRRLGSDVANRFRLALSYEQLLNALAACPQSADASYLNVFGQLASQVATYYTAVSGGSTESTSAPVQRQSAATQSGQVSFRFNFSLSLQIRR